MATLQAAMLACRIPLDDPAPGVALVDLCGDGAVYEIGLSVASSARLMEARTEILAQVQNHLHHAGIALAVTGLATVPKLSVPRPTDLLERSDLFGIIAPAERDLIAEHMAEVWLKPGEPLIRQGEDPVALYVLASGAVEITRDAGTGPHVVHRMGPGGSLGAIGLITGAPYAATAIALTPVKAYRLDKAAILAAMEIRPELTAGLEDLARRGQAALSSDVAAEEDHHLEQSEMFLSRMRAFLHKLAAERGRP